MNFISLYVSVNIYVVILEIDHQLQKLIMVEAIAFVFSSELIREEKKKKTHYVDGLSLTHLLLLPNSIFVYSKR